VLIAAFDESLNEVGKTVSGSTVIIKLGPKHWEGAFNNDDASLFIVCPFVESINAFYTAYQHLKGHVIVSCGGE